MALPRPAWPSAAFADLRAFLATRERHHWGFAVLSLFIPLYFVTLFVLEAEDKQYKPPDVVFVEKIDETRTDAQIRADQKIDSAKRKAEAERVKKWQEERSRQFKELDKALDDWGF